MKVPKKSNTYFEKSTSKSPEEIKFACSRMQSTAKDDYDIHSNGNHIWVGMPEKKQQYWSPILHLSMTSADNKTYIIGEFAEKPLLWVVFLAAKLVSIPVFLFSFFLAYCRYSSGTNYNVQLFTMFGMVSVWFAIYLIAEHYKRKGARQIEALQDFVDQIA